MRARGLALALVLLGPAAARADDLDVQVKNKVPQGKGKPSLELVAHASIAQVAVDLTGGPAEVHLKLGPVRAGWRHTVVLDPGPKAAHLTGTLHLRYPAKEGKDDVEMPLDFEAEVVAPPTVAVKAEDLDLEHHRLTATFTRTAAKAHLEALGEDGQQLVDTEVDLHGLPAGSPLQLEWPAGGGAVLKLHIRVDDPDGFYAGLDLFPWRVDIPHEEVVFASGASAVPPGDAPKLDASLALIQAAVKRAGRFADLRVYVAGHTDTVGSAEDNQRLSEGRARAIGEYFRTHGLRVPILYVGYGEKALAVPTADEVAEPRNRRAEYIVAITDPAGPPGSGATPWKHL
jgi:hypothetical protein